MKKKEEVCPNYQIESAMLQESSHLAQALELIVGPDAEVRS